MTAGRMVWGAGGGLVSCGGVALVVWYLVLGVVGHVGLSGGLWVAHHT